MVDMLAPTPRFVLLSLLIGLSLACGIREDELRCEEAASHLVSCCPTFHKELLDCTFFPGSSNSNGCNTSHHPDISIATARCITDLDCATIERTGYCTRVEQDLMSGKTVTCP